MRYKICDVELNAPLPLVKLSENESGLAVLVRRDGRPIWFWMEKCEPNSVIEPHDLAARISTHCAGKLLNESIREELLHPASSIQHSASFPTLTIAICTHDRPDRLTRCIASLPRDVPEILIVDNAPSDDRTRDLVAANPHIRYIREPKPGLDFARNRALREATGELLAFLDDDVVVDREWLDGLREAHRENPDAAAFTGLILPLMLETEAQILFEQFGGFRGGETNGFEKIRWEKILPGQSNYPCEAGIFGAGANMVFRRETLLDLSGFDDALDTGAPLPGGGDLDIFYRIIRAGHVIAYEPRMLVFHEHRREMESLRRQYWSWGIGFMAFAAKSLRADVSQRKKWARLLAWWFVKYQAKQLVKALLNRPAPPAKMVVAEIFGALDGLCGGYSRSQRRVARLQRQHA